MCWKETASYTEGFEGREPAPLPSEGLAPRLRPCAVAVLPRAPPSSTARRERRVAAARPTS